MSFVPNESQQMSFNDPLLGLTPREQKYLEQSWAKHFSEKIFPKINEKRFSVLYSEKYSRPNTPVNVIIGALLLKELQGLSDDGIMEALMFDIRYQYALHTGSYKEQPLSDRTLGRFRARCNTYETETGIDLIHEEMESLSKEIARMLSIDGSLKRMDSMMVSSNIKKMSRLELLYTCVSNMVKELQDDNVEIPDSLSHYTEDTDLNKVVYHSRSEDLGERIAKVLSEAKQVKELCGSGYDESNNYQLLIRVLKEQTTEEPNGDLRLKDKADISIDSKILQNPADPEATYRVKGGKQYRGYIGNVVEDVHDGMSIATSYDFKQNIYSDSQFAKDTIEKLGKQDKSVTMVADGGYDSEENAELAKENNVELVTTDLLGRKPNEIIADFVFNDDQTRIVSCPAGYEPKSCSYNKKREVFQLSFRKEHCENCPYKDQCKPKPFTKTYKIRLTKKSHKRAEQIRYRKTEEFKQLSNIRNGVETVPSVLRRKYNIDTMPVRGLQKCRMLFGLKLCASNIMKFCRYLQDRDKYTLMPEMT